jgi:hypothetical protein
MRVFAPVYIAETLGATRQDVEMSRQQKTPEPVLLQQQFQLWGLGRNFRVPDDENGRGNKISVGWFQTLQLASTGATLS